jgi:hypothetical protein
MSFGFLPPRTSDGRIIFLPSTMADSLEVQFTGCGDDITNGIRNGGVDFKKTANTAGTYDVDFQFMENVDIAGGGVLYTGANLGDYVHYSINAPATVGTENAGSGVFDKFNVGGPYNMYVPNATQEGDWDIDLEELLNENVSFTKAVPVPASANDGFFDYDRDTGILNLNAEQGGRYNLFDFDITMARFINKIWLVGAHHHNLIVAASYGAKKLLPQWTHRVTINRVGEGVLDVAWYIFIGRVSSQPG